MAELFDTHCHLAHGRLRQQVDDVIARAAAAGVTRMICATGDLTDSKAALSIVRERENLWCSAGIHPHEAKDAPSHYLTVLEELAADAKNVAVGEIGLDYHYDFSPRDAQQRIFAEQLALARRLGKVVVMHTREAFDDSVGVLRESGIDTARVVLHCCTEPPANVRRALDMGMMISFSGIVTFKKTDELRQAAAIVPDDRLLIETDSPFCSPEPVRRMHPNEPANVAHVAARLAAVRGAAPEAIAELTTASALRFFGLGDDSPG
jgi:TatD DNase family protein